MNTATLSIAKFILALRASILSRAEIPADVARQAGLLAMEHNNVPKLLLFAPADADVAAQAWLRIAGHNTGQSQIGALTVAAYLAHAADDHATVAFAIAWQRHVASELHTEVPPDTRLLSLDHRTAQLLANAG